MWLSIRPEERSINHISILSETRRNKDKSIGNEEVVHCDRGIQRFALKFWTPRMLHEFKTKDSRLYHSLPVNPKDKKKCLLVDCRPIHNSQVVDKIKS